MQSVKPSCGSPRRWQLKAARALPAKMLARSKRRTSFRSANALIEMAIAMPVLIGLAMGMAEFGQFFYIKNTFETAARDVARFSVLSTAQQSDPVTYATAAFARANITFQPSWMTMLDASTVTVVTDVSQVPAGHALTVIVQQYYDQIPGVYRPLYQMTGQGIANGKKVLGLCTMVKE
jgi:Flp pilus assembly protein TadG